MNHLRCTALLLAALLACTLAACFGGGGGGQTSSSRSQEQQEEPDPNWPVAIGDIRVAEKPERIVSLSPALTEVLYELGGGDRMAGVSTYCDFPADIGDLPDCGTAQSPDLDRLRELSPDVVFVSAPLTQPYTIALQQMGAEVVVLPRADSIDALETTYVTAATVLDGMQDGDANGRRVFGALRARYDALTDAAGGIADRVSGIYLRAVPLLIATGDTFEGQLLKAIGVDNDAAAFTGWNYPADQAVNLYPDVIFYDSSIDPAYFAGTQVYSTTDAYLNGRLYPVDAVALERQSARMFEELERMFSEAYPDVSVATPGTADEPDAGQEGEAASEQASDASLPQDAPSSGEMLDLDDATQVIE